MKNRRKIEFIVQAAIIAAAYTALTYAANAMNLAYGGVQFRFSEALTVLPLFTPAAIPGLAIGCALSNIMSPFWFADIPFGTAATLAAAVLTYLLRNIKIRDFPFLALVPPVIINGIVVGFEISYFFLPEGNLMAGFLTQGLYVMAGEAAVIALLGVPLVMLLKKRNIFIKNNV